MVAFKLSSVRARVAGTADKGGERNILCPAAD
jgi:hypothetical protein